MNPMKTQALAKECRNYYLNQAMVKAYEKADAMRGPHVDSPAGLRARKQYEMMAGQIAHVDHVRSFIRRHFGTEAEQVFTSCCIEGMNIENAAARYAVPTEVFEERMEYWLEKESEESV